MTVHRVSPGAPPTSTRPPCAWVIAAAMAGPRPAPLAAPGAREREAVELLRGERDLRAAPAHLAGPLTQHQVAEHPPPSSATTPPAPERHSSPPL
ncbi:MAG: hypothetical protein JF597_16340 [Streptomyces sp.]|uniref:hypothetical protein n=1 Tax=Streptomyces sp. TaxID=1931 RepID=UPI0034530402|nr:hypothetical protein [Streptomyces sp.]